MAESQRPTRLLIICLGNICRSPMAEGLLRARIEASPLRGSVQLDSVGTGNWHVGEPPDRRAIATMRRHGIDISSLCARHLAEADYREFDWLLCADGSNLRDLHTRAPTNIDKRASLLLEWAELADQELEIPDPYCGGERDFEQVFQLLDRAASSAVLRLLRERDGH